MEVVVKAGTVHALSQELKAYFEKVQLPVFHAPHLSMHHTKQPRTFEVLRRRRSLFSCTQTSL